MEILEKGLQSKNITDEISYFTSKCLEGVERINKFVPPKKIFSYDPQGERKS
jgi:hypothetical protein